MAMWISRFLRSITSRWSVTLKSNGKSTMKRKVQRGILYPIDSAQEDTRKHLIRSASWIAQRSRGGQHSRTECGAGAA
ncbi:unnamed protein product [Thelazia callipaeda]|uniref:Secreted protein n=1 Tax=Thelazia callipaeda TaxID=103827 RepID=A0A0N5CQ25_THECL|nr:unnamed protein product [Thelazia callipaeda]